MVGLQTTVRGAHHTKPSTVKQFMERMTKYFNGWETFAADLSWEIIYVQHGESEAITTWQECKNFPKLDNSEDATQRRRSRGRARRRGREDHGVLEGKGISVPGDDIS
ncbi:retrotransposon hot spot (RHS) protein [Trypanosoma conorhini]|uniref:Retrotransposon hot spot (RHS) protein n=1 Tax=Trypanosoma conorhini TaxID=83891 RepID=A0A422MRQ3_9TRYP|nr:retrotransposon hot spot (RHS) protein [Trypanosoma conorhini]RNE95874.1 retrotransposon hot spot (RHS) protein [Trypanosoma conorhini]